MSIQAVGWAFEQTAVPARPKLVLLAIANHANHVDGYCWLKVETIAREAACSPRAVHNYLGALIRNGFVRKAARRGDDGKQRASDYWLLFNRDPDCKWIGAAVDVSQEDDEAATPDAEDETQDVGDGLHGLQSAESAETEPSEPVEKPTLAVGPSAPACSHIESAEPSESKPEEDARANRFRPRSYQPPPPPKPQPVGEIVGEKIFVFEGTPAYEAWAKVKAAENRVTRWRLTTTRYVDGKRQTGWYFPTLFPKGSDPPKEESSAA